MDILKRACYLVLCISIILVFSCARKEKKLQYLIGFSQYSSVEPIREAINKSIFEEAEKYFDLLMIKFADAQQDTMKQSIDIENFLKLDIDLLIVAPGEGELVKNAIKKVYESKKPVIVLDKMLDGEYYTCYIGVDNKEIGVEVGEYVVKILNGKGNIVEICGHPNSYVTIERSNGFREVVSKYPEIRIVHTDFADWLIPLAITRMEIALRKYKKIDLVYAYNDAMAIGAYLASRSQGRENQIIFIGTGGLPGQNGGLKAIIDRKLNATFLYPTYGKEALQYALDILNGKIVPKVVKLESNLITIENVNSFLK